MQYILDFIWTLFYGIIEGITEWLPISSTGHLIIFESFTKPSFSDAFLEMFRVVIQLGAILAVVVIFWKKIWPFHTSKHLDTYSYKSKTSLTEFATKYCYMDKIILWLKILVACLPAIIIGLPFDDWMDKHLYNEFTVATTLIIGCFQVLSLVPGTSRSGSTILGAIILCCSRTAAAEFSFLLGIPVMFGASGLKAVKFLAEGNALSGFEWSILLFGMIVAFVVSMFTISFLMNFVKKHNFKCFGYYRIALGILLLALSAFITV